MATVRIEGLKDINRVLSELPKSVGKPVLTRFGKKRLEPMRASAAQRAPKDTGELAGEFIVGTKTSGGKGRGVRRAEIDGVEIFMGPSRHVGQKAVPQEFGSINNPPQGMMRGAWDAHHGALLDNLAGDLGAAVDGAAKRHAKRMARKG